MLTRKYEQTINYDLFLIIAQNYMTNFVDILHKNKAETLSILPEICHSIVSSMIFDMSPRRGGGPDAHRHFHHA